MSSIKTSLLIAILACVSACGRQVVEFKLDGGDGTDAPVDASVDAPIEIRPIVTSTMPASDATGVALTTSPTATFSKPMNAGTLTTTTFTLRQGSTSLVGALTVNTAGTTVTFDPTSDLIAGLVYTATITTGAQDLGGLALAANYTWMFTAAANAFPPTVIATTPAPNATNVSLNVSPTATFSKAMNPTTINATSFTLVQGATPIAGVVTLNSATNTATFNPTVNLTAGLVYTATITTAAQDTGGLALTANHMWTFTAGAAVLPPTVTLTTPGMNAPNVALGVNLTATFSQPMNATTINATTFTLFQGLTQVTGVVTYDALTNTATFNPTLDLTAGLVYTARITTGAQDTNGLALAAPFSWMFTTGTAVVPPTVTVTTPAPGATNVALNVSPTATFSRAMNATTINATTFTLFQGLTPVTGVVTYDALTNTATFNPTVDLTAGTYTATITTGAQDTNGVALAAPFSWMFTTGSAVVPPTVTVTTPAPGATNVALNV
nr:Ig-like domain-containing protein [Deltaproteobacteria bacterium]